MPSRGRSLGTDHLLVFVADGAEPVMAGHNVELAAVFAHSNIAASEMTHLKLPERRLLRTINFAHSEADKGK